MEKKRAAKKEDKSGFLRRLVRENPRMTYHEMNQRWAAAGRTGEISSALYNRVRADVAIQLMEERAAARAVAAPEVPERRVPIEICQFKITLLDVLPLVWRRIQVQNWCSLDTLHEHIQNAMGWADTHPHHFVIDGILYGSSSVLGDTFKERHYWRTSSTHLKDVLPQDSSRFRFEYEYDFESAWRHEILFEGRPPADEKRHYPLCVEGQRACPPEDVGGPAGYADFLRVIIDPNNPQHLETRQRLGRPFHPDAFDPEAVSRNMRSSSFRPTLGFPYRRR
jgi:Plasmid pRiA4b ORF-3-like protein